MRRRVDAVTVIVQDNLPAASYWLRHVLDAEMKQSSSCKGPGGGACNSLHHCLAPYVRTSSEQATAN